MRTWSRRRVVLLALLCGTAPGAEAQTESPRFEGLPWGLPREEAVERLGRAGYRVESAEPAGVLVLRYGRAGRAEVRFDRRERLVEARRFVVFADGRDAFVALQTHAAGAASRLGPPDPSSVIPGTVEADVWRSGEQEYALALESGMEDGWRLEERFLGPGADRNRAERTASALRDRFADAPVRWAVVHADSLFRISVDTSTVRTPRPVAVPALAAEGHGRSARGLVPPPGGGLRRDAGADAGDVDGGRGGRATEEGWRGGVDRSAPHHPRGGAAPRRLRPAARAGRRGYPRSFTAVPLALTISIPPPPPMVIVS